MIASTSRKEPKPRGTPDEIVTATREMYREISPEAGEFFDIMVDEELLDLINRKCRAGSAPTSPRATVYLL